MILVFACSPHAGGVSDCLAESVAAGARSLEQDTRLIALGKQKISGCSGCNACNLTPGRCFLPPDAADAFFDSLMAAQSVIFVAPIYFYSLPGQFKLFIDRSQKFWGPLLATAEIRVPVRQAGVILVAGRANGKKIFAGALLTLKWFLVPFGYRIACRELFSGLEKRADILPEQEEQAWQMGRKLACA